MKTRGYAATDVGRVRTNNEDTHLVNEEIGLYVVCDGMGGHAAGEVASYQAAKTLNEYLTRNNIEIGEMSVDEDLKGVQDLVVEAVRDASNHVFEQSQASGHSGMGTTLTLLLTVGDRAVIASVGDSRAYHCRKKFVELLTSDHTLAYELIQNGQIPAEEAKNHPFGHCLTRSIGGEGDVKVDTLVTHFVAGDIFLLCTDGLSNNFDRDEELGDYMFKKPSEIPSGLVSMANARGGKDNITVIVVHVTEDPPAVKPAERKWFARIA